MPLPQFDALWAEHAQPSHASRRDIHGQLLPIAHIVAIAQKQVAHYRALVTELELSEHHADLDWKAERLVQTFGALERDVSALADASRRVGFAWAQLDRVMAEDKEQIAAWELAQAAKATAGPAA